jgi:hypothetical protein
MNPALSAEPFEHRRMSMKPPFTVDQLLNLFARYNTDVWPLQILFIVLALFAVWLALKTNTWSSRVVASILGVLWLWIGIVFHVIYFSQINTGAYVFGILNIIQAVAFIYYGVMRSSLSFRFQNNFFGMSGAVLMVYALLIYPLLGYTLDHVYPQSPTFGLPCPTTIFSFGILLWTDKRVPLPVLIVPLLWSLIGFTAALNYGIVEDSGLLVAGVLGSALIIILGKRTKSLA